MKKEPGFWREDFVKDALIKLYKKLRRNFNEKIINKPLDRHNHKTLI